MDFFSALLDRAAPQQPNVLRRRRPSRFEPQAEVTCKVADVAAPDDGNEAMPATRARHAAANQHDSNPARDVLRSDRVDAMGHPPHKSQSADRDAPGGVPQATPGADRFSAIGPATEPTLLADEFARLAAAVAALQARPPQHDLMLPAATAEMPMESKNKANRAEGDDVAVLNAGRSGHTGRNAAQAEGAAPASALPSRKSPVQAPLPVASMPVQRRPSAALHAPVAAPASSALQPRLPPMPRPAAATTTARRVIAAAPPAPAAVHVSIGRVEIRAVAAPSTARSPRGAQTHGPKLSLDDYLKARNGEQR